jgi:hypothetical protein
MPRHLISARSTNAEVVESAVLDIRQIDDPPVQAMYLAEAAAACVQWSRSRASELAREAVAKLEQPGARVADTSGKDELTAAVESLKHVISRSTIIEALAEIDPKLALSTAECAIDDPKELDSARVTIALAASETDPAWSKRQLQAIHDPAQRALAVLADAASDSRSGRLSRAVVWGDVQAALPQVQRLEGAGERAQMLTMLGAVARRTGRDEEWDTGIKPQVFAAITSIRDLSDRSNAYSDCLMAAAALDPTLVPELLTRAKQDIGTTAGSDEHRTVLLIRVMQGVDPMGALRLVEKLGTPQLKALSLIGILLKAPDDKPEAVAAGADMGLALLRERSASGLSTTAVRVLLSVIAKSRPDAAMEIAQREGKAHGEEQRFYASILTGAAKTQPDWALSRVDMLDDPSSRVQVMLQAVRRRAKGPGTPHAAIGTHSP